MIPVLMLFLIPVGGGIPAGVLLAQRNGVGWPAMTFLYFVSDVILAFLFEPILRLFVAVGRKVAFLARMAEALRRGMDRTAAYYGGAGAGPFTLVMIAFGIDPMTGRSAAAAAGHGFVAGWTIAIAGDMLFFLLVAAATLKLSAALGDPNQAMAIILVAMLVAPYLFRRAKEAFKRLPAPP